MILSGHDSVVSGCAADRPNRWVSQGFPMQTRKADRIMAGQNHAERKIGGALLNDSVVSGCGFAALCSLPLILLSAFQFCSSSAFVP
jgi:hypothetical protein